MEHGLKRFLLVTVGTILVLTAAFSLLYPDMSFIMLLLELPAMTMQIEKISFGHIILGTGPALGALDYLSAKI